MIHNGAAFIAPTAVLSEDTTLWWGAIVEDGVVTGPRCVIGSYVFVGARSRLGESVRIQHGAFITRDTIIGNFVFIGPNVTLTDDKYPRVNNPNYQASPPILEDHCSIGAGAIILPGVIIGEGAVVGAGAVVIHSVPAKVIVMGVPARRSATSDNGGYGLPRSG